MPFLRTSWLLVSLAVLALSGCGSSSPAERPSADDGATRARGQAVYATPLADGNSFACSTCHALREPAGDDLRRPGHPIGDATRRSRWKNGRASSFLDAVNSCVTDWMIAPSWSPTEPRFVALRAFLDAQAGVEHAPDLHFEIAAPPADLTKGDAARGRSTFAKTCIVCHGTDGAGTDRGPRIAHSMRAADYIALRVRTSGPAASSVYPTLTGGVMPFWAKDRLTDDELRDLVAFVRGASPDVGSDQEAGVEPSGGPDAEAGAAPTDAPLVDVTTGPNDAAVSPVDAAPDVRDAGTMPSGCTKQNPRVGWKADLGINTGEGQVSGLVTMVDDCTLQLTNFSYDGNGIEVRVYGSKSSTFRPGFAIGPDLFGHVYKKATLSVTLPAGKTLNDLDWVSIWCIKAGANFGSGPFVAQ